MLLNMYVLNYTEDINLNKKAKWRAYMQCKNYVFLSLNLDLRNDLGTSQTETKIVIHASKQPDYTFIGNAAVFTHDAA